MAATGGMREARSAGTMAADTVTPTPTIALAMIVRVDTMSAAEGKAAPAALKMATMPLATPMPAMMPTNVATIETTNASPMIMVRICRVLAPTARRSANSRRRWLTMMAKVLKMRKALTNNDTAAKPRRMLPKMSMMSLIAPAVSWADCSPVITSRPSGSARSMAAITVSRSTPSSMAT